jgi:hypothetical protein
MPAIALFKAKILKISSQMQIPKKRIEYESHEQKYNRIALTNDRC